MPNPSLVTIADVEVKFETERALLVLIAEDEYWIPKSVIHDDSEVYEMGTSGDLVIPLWFAQKENIPL